MSAAFTLALDASTYVGTVAVLRDGVVLAEGDAAMRGEREERLMPAVVATLAEAGCTPREVSRVVCGAGPGSFTSLRIAGAIAKGIALGTEAELWAVSSLALIVAGHATPLPAGRYLAMLDAMRGERYAVAYEVSAGGAVHEVERVGLVADAAVAATCERLGASAIGPHQPLDVAPHARGVARLDGGTLVRRVALDAWEPEYGRLAEAQVKWEAAHGRPLGA
ncbi:MAG: tRNA (adenosine(37)-N6)-threonylcarbamoyltransferase complex dimerization subunit type 1 TsaB [Gemmatimonadetes bacterium]|nr:tRNA (adenosine(37)-N6)-threonylcarbamoyltransferase complex dimerization subunit type 1 TsaB [Gemmatimonadota bacterium]MBI3566626.1 tRNA (adenosine(37)-N6)-threonylcarbamoyltransferase complex dimerization subunit type 1 TsaB [Gemmatimonadota bacterium]